MTAWSDLDGAQDVSRRRAAQTDTEREVEDLLRQFGAIDPDDPAPDLVRALRRLNTDKANALEAAEAARAVARRAKGVYTMIVSEVVDVFGGREAAEEHAREYGVVASVRRALQLAAAPKEES